MEGKGNPFFTAEYQLTNRKRMTGNHIVQHNWPELFKNIEVQNNRERLRKCYRLNETKTT